MRYLLLDFAPPFFNYKDTPSTSTCASRSCITFEGREYSQCITEGELTDITFHHTNLLTIDNKAIVTMKIAAVLALLAS
jgi:hypothetical protein